MQNSVTRQVYCLTLKMAMLQADWFTERNPVDVERKLPCKAMNNARGACEDHVISVVLK